MYTYVTATNIMEPVYFSYSGKFFTYSSIPNWGTTDIQLFRPNILSIKARAHDMDYHLKNPNKETNTYIHKKNFV